MFWFLKQPENQCCEIWRIVTADNPRFLSVRGHTQNPSPGKHQDLLVKVWIQCSCCWFKLFVNNSGIDEKRITSIDFNLE